MIRARFISGLVFLIVLAATFTAGVLPHLRIETDLLALLPRHEGDARIDAAIDAFSTRVSRQVVFLIGSRQPEAAKRGARAFVSALNRGTAFVSVHGEVTSKLRDTVELYLRHRFDLLSQRDQSALEAGDLTALYRDALRAAYTPAGLFRPLDVAEDPLGLGSGYLLAQAPPVGAAQLEDSHLIVNRGELTFVVVTAEVNGSPFSVDVQDNTRRDLRRARSAAAAASPARLTVVSSGVLEHATVATRDARREISLFGAIDTIFVLGIMLALFRSWRAPVLGLLALATGGVAGLTAAHLIFGPVHLIALVFGTSLIGVAIDYAMHFFSDQFRVPRGWSPRDALAHVAKPIVLGLTVALLGYCGLVLLPFPGLRQMAVISIAGLIAACICVLTIFPVWARASGRAVPEWCARSLDRFDRIGTLVHRRKARLALALLAVLAVGVGLARVRPQDDVRTLQANAPYALEQDRQVRDILEIANDSRFFVVRGRDAEAVLQTEERLSGLLDRAIERHQLDGYSSVTASLPSLARQKQARALLHGHVYNEHGLLSRLMRELGFEEAAIARELSAFGVAAQPLTPAEWLASGAADSYRHLWLGDLRGEFATIVALDGIHDAAALNTLAGGISGVRFIDRVADISKVLAQYRRAVLTTLLLIYGIVGVVLTLRYGIRDTARLLSAPAGATLLTLAFAGWVGLPLTLFVSLALLLLLGLGVDYAIFLQEAGAEYRTARLAVTLSALTTMVSFGLLSFSSTPLIHAIGVTLAIGIAGCWLLAVAGHALRLNIDNIKNQKVCKTP